MTPVNPFILKHKEKMISFLDELSVGMGVDLLFGSALVITHISWDAFDPLPLPSQKYIEWEERKTRMIRMFWNPSCILIVCWSTPRSLYLYTLFNIAAAVSVTITSLSFKRTTWVPCAYHLPFCVLFWITCGRFTLKYIKYRSLSEDQLFYEIVVVRHNARAKRNSSDKSTSHFSVS